MEMGRTFQKEYTRIKLLKYLFYNDLQKCPVVKRRCRDNTHTNERLWKTAFTKTRKIKRTVTTTAIRILTAGLPFLFTCKRWFIVLNHWFWCITFRLF